MTMIWDYINSKVNMQINMPFINQSGSLITLNKAEHLINSAPDVFLNILLLL